MIIRVEQFNILLKIKFVIKYIVFRQMYKYNIMIIFELSWYFMCN